MKRPRRDWLAAAATAYTVLAEAPPADAAAPPAPADPVTWAGPIGMEGEVTGDGRLIEPGVLRWELDNPLPLRYVASDVGAHDGAAVVGRILAVSRRPGGVIYGEGDLDPDSPIGAEAIRQVGNKLTNGVSMDLDDVSFELRIAKELLEDDDGGMGLLLASDGDKVEATQTTDDGDHVTVLTMNAGDELMVTTDARLRAATIVAIPAFANARIELTSEYAGAPFTTTTTTQGGRADGTDEDPDNPGTTTTTTTRSTSASNDVAALAASAVPLRPPEQWFTDPQLAEPTALRVLADGRIFGHLATWGTCHIGFPGECVTAPTSDSGYAHFRTGAVLTNEGSEVAVGHITMGTGHAGPRENAQQALAHYDNTGTVVADVATGEDAHGIWVAGALRRGVKPDQVRALRSSPLSGDWRRIGAGLELVAALAVNVPGFPIPRPQGLVAGGHTRSLVASGMLAPSKVARPGSVGSLSDEDLRYLKMLANKTKADHVEAITRTARAASLARRVSLATTTEDH